MTPSRAETEAAYKRGKADHARGRSEFGQNPYTLDSGLRPYWAAGWNFAYEEKLCADARRANRRVY